VYDDAGTERRQFVREVRRSDVERDRLDTRMTGLGAPAAGREDLDAPVARQRPADAGAEVPVAADDDYPHEEMPPVLERTASTRWTRWNIHGREGMHLQSA
jgi:hypothetical protein